MMITEEHKSVIPIRPHQAKRVGDGCFYLDMILFLNGDRIELGEKVGFNFGCFINGFGGLSIGDRTLFGPYVMVMTANYNTDNPDALLKEAGFKMLPITIGRDCCIGMGTQICPGVTIGDGVIVGAGSVVCKDLPDWTVCVGNPCKVMRHRREALCKA